VQHRLGIISALAEQHDVRSGLLDKMPAEGFGRFWTMRMMGANMAYRRSALLDVGGFDEFYEWVYDDSDLAVRLAAAGYFIQPGAEASVYHVPASSRNRVAYTYHGRWWIQTKASVYFCIRNGRQAGVPRRVIAKRIAHFVHGHMLWQSSLHRQGQISFKQMLAMESQEIKATLIGATSALLRPKALLKQNASVEDNDKKNSMQFFPDNESPLQPSVDPISGRRPTITLMEPPLRVALLSHHYPPQRYEGVGRHTNLMAKGLFELGHTVHVLTHGAKENISFYDGAYVHHVPYRPTRYLHLRQLHKVHHLLNYSHAVHERLQRLVLNDDIQLVDSPVWQADGFVCALSSTLPVVVRPQTAQRQIGQIERSLDDDTRLVGEIEEALLRHASFIAANSNATVAALSSVYGLRPGEFPTHIIPHGIEPVDDELVRPFAIDKPPRPLTVLYVGRLERRKGIQDLFAAIRHVQRRVPAVQFLIAGADNSQSDGFRQRTGMSYPAYFQKHYPECKASVTFLGEVTEEQLQTLYQRCDLFVAPSLYESFGLIYLEAMNYAKPVVGCRAGGIPEVVDDGVTGRLVDPNSPEQLADAIVEFLRSPQRLYDYGVAGRQRLLDRFTHIHMARGFEQVYRQVLSKLAQAAQSTQQIQ
jgi:glycosyltransferase involved in cell wall biosynthesis